MLCPIRSVLVFSVTVVSFLILMLCSPCPCSIGGQVCTPHLAVCYHQSPLHSVDSIATFKWLLNTFLFTSTFRILLCLYTSMTVQHCWLKAERVVIINDGPLSILGSFTCPALGIAYPACNIIWLCWLDVLWSGLVMHQNTHIRGFVSMHYMV